MQRDAGATKSSAPIVRAAAALPSTLPILQQKQPQRLDVGVESQAVDGKQQVIAVHSFSLLLRTMIRCLRRDKADELRAALLWCARECAGSRSVGAQKGLQRSANGKEQTLGRQEEALPAPSVLNLATSSRMEATRAS